MQRLGITDRATARREIERNDAAHNGTMQRLFGIDWTDPALYASVLNTARIPIADCVEHIVNVAGSPAFQETAQSRMALSDQLILSKVHSALDRRLGSSATALGLDAEVEAGKVVLKGALSDQRLIAETVRLMHSISESRPSSAASRTSHLCETRLVEQGTSAVHPIRCIGCSVYSSLPTSAQSLPSIFSLARLPLNPPALAALASSRVSTLTLKRRSIADQRSRPTMRMYSSNDTPLLTSSSCSDFKSSSASCMVRAGQCAQDVRALPLITRGRSVVWSASRAGPKEAGRRAAKPSVSSSQKPFAGWS